MNPIKDINDYTPSEIKDIAYGFHEGFEEVDEIELGQGRWDAYMQTIVRRNVDRKLFSIRWSRGLTEMQPNEFFGAQLIPVERKVRTVEEVYYEEI